MSSVTVDLRSDTVTQPCAPMRQAMAAAEVGDDVYDEDPTVHQLEQRLADMAGHESGLFCPSGTQSNLLALLSHCQRGDEYIVGQEAHTYKYEGGGAAVLGSIQPQPIELAQDGTMPLAKIEAAIKADDFHFAKTRLLALENTIGGRVVPPAYIAAACELAGRHRLGLHLDGARVFNAAVAQNLPLSAITRSFDSVSICLSKGLGAPVGSVLVANRELVQRAKRWRKMLGGGMRQAGILAAAGIYALDNNIERLAEDHALAQRLATELNDIDGLTVVDGQAHTNMVYLACDPANASELAQWCAARGLLIGSGNPARLVVHKDISEAQISQAETIVRDYFRRD